MKAGKVKGESGKGEKSVSVAGCQTELLTKCASLKESQLTKNERDGK